MVFGALGNATRIISRSTAIFDKASFILTFHVLNPSSQLKFFLLQSQMFMKILQKCVVQINPCHVQVEELGLVNITNEMN